MKKSDIYKTTAQFIPVEKFRDMKIWQGSFWQLLWALGHLVMRKQLNVCSTHCLKQIEHLQNPSISDMVETPLFEQLSTDLHNHVHVITI